MVRGNALLCVLAEALADYGTGQSYRVCSCAVRPCCNTNVLVLLQHLQGLRTIQKPPASQASSLQQTSLAALV